MYAVRHMVPEIMRCRVLCISIVLARMLWDSLKRSMLAKPLLYRSRMCVLWLSGISGCMASQNDQHYYTKLFVFSSLNPKEIGITSQEPITFLVVYCSVPQYCLPSLNRSGSSKSLSNKFCSPDVPVLVWGSPGYSSGFKMQSKLHHRYQSFPVSLKHINCYRPLERWPRVTALFSWV